MARDTLAKTSGAAGILAAIMLAGCGTALVEVEEEGALQAEAAAVQPRPAEEAAEKGAVEEPTEAAEAAGAFVLRINCGSDADYEDPDGNVWKADQPFEEGGWGYEGGGAVTRSEDIEIKKTALGPLYRTERYSLDRYRISVPNGRYSVALHVAETYWEVIAAGERIYDIDIEGEKLLPGFDPVKAAGGSACTAVVKSFDVEVTDGELTVGFTPEIQSAMINGIEVVGK